MSSNQQILEKADSTQVEDINLQSNNRQFNDDVEKIQQELEQALHDIIQEFGKTIKPNEREIEQGFNEINELLERLKTGQVWVCLFGKASVGKSAVANALIGADEAYVDIAHGSTTEIQNYSKSPWRFVDVTGIMNSVEHDRMALEEAQKAHGHLFVVDGEPYEPELKLFDLVCNATPDVPKIVFVNKWDCSSQIPKKDRETIQSRIEEKMGKYVKSPNDIVYGSALLYDPEYDVMVRQELPELLDRMYNDAGVFGKLVNILDPAKRAADLSQEMRDKLFEVRAQVARKFINAFGIANAFNGVVPFSTLLVTPGILVSMVYTVARILGKEQDRDSSRKLTITLIRECGLALGAIFGASLVAEALVDVASTALVPMFGLGALLGLVADTAALGWFKYQRTVVLGEVAIEYIRQGGWGDDDPRTVILRCRDRAKEYYSRLKRK
jgi:GTP-binding protein EngB required for normal cell division/uncharacterized protein (DUF697 family)